MSSSFFKLFFYLCIFIIIVTLLVCLFPSQSITSSYGETGIITSNSGFVWPLTNYNYISSYFGYRTAPTFGASTYHSGIDIPAPADTPILAICPGTVTFASWGAGRWLYCCCKK